MMVWGRADRPGINRSADGSADALLMGWEPSWGVKFNEAIAAAMTLCAGALGGICTELSDPVPGAGAVFFGTNMGRAAASKAELP